MNQKGQKGFVNILVVVLVVAVVAVAGYFVLVERPAVPVTEESEEASLFVADEVSSPVVPADDTANWRTYRNEEYGIELKYPPEWTFSESDVGSLFVASGFPSLSVSFGPGLSSFGRIFEFGCLEGGSIRKFRAAAQNGGKQSSGIGNDTTINLAGMDLTITGVVEPPPQTDHGESFGYRVYRCNENNVCAIFFRYSAPIEAQDREFMESLRFLKDFDGWDQGQCFFGRG